MVDFGHALKSTIFLLSYAAFSGGHMNRFVRNFCAAWLSIAMLAASATVIHAAENGQHQGTSPPPWANGQSHRHAQLEGRVHRLEAELKARGYDVARGSTKLFTIADCQYAVTVLGNCMGNNPAAPYIMPTMPLWPDEFVDEGLRGVLGPLPNDNWATHRMDKREAVLVVGMLPPPARYFGIQTYVFSRAGAFNTSDPVYQRTLLDPVMHNLLFSVVPKSPSRVLVFSSIGNSINNVTIERQSGAAFDQRRAFIISTDKGMAQEMTDAIVRARVSNKDNVFDEPVSSSLVRLGLGAEADDFMTIIRYAQPEDEDAAEAWRQQRPVAVLRVRDGNANGTEPWPKPVYDQKTARSELALADNVSALVAAIRQQWGQPGAFAGQFLSLQLSVDLIGQHCLARPMNCLGDNQDTDYQLSPTVIPDDNTVIAVAGTLGTATGNATYVGLSVNRIADLTAVANVSDEDVQGSAALFSKAVADTDKLYVQYFARNCTGIAHCLVITEDMIPKGAAIKIIQRNYVVPGTARGPDPTQLVNPVAIILDRSSVTASR
jgi:hypothetical protein